MEYRPDSLYCPVRALLDFLDYRGIGEFLFTSGSNTVITRKWFADYLTYALSGLELDRSTYNTHSFRIGRATDMALDGFSITKIKLHGRWKSYIFIKYLRPDIIYM